MCGRASFARLPILLLLLAAAGGAWPSHITLVIATTNTVLEKQLQCHVRVTNKGDEAASNLRVRVEFHGQRQASAPLPELGLGQSHDASFTLPLSDAVRGRHSLAIFVDYSDAAGYRFSTPSHAELIVGEDNPPKLQAAMGNVELGSEAVLKLRVKNLDSTSRLLKLKLVLPREITSPQSESEMVMAGLGEQALQFPLRNNAAAAGRD
jgi:hypothetical protein